MKFDSWFTYSQNGCYAKSYEIQTSVKVLYSPIDHGFDGNEMKHAIYRPSTDFFKIKSNELTTTPIMFTIKANAHGGVSKIFTMKFMISKYDPECNSQKLTMTNKNFVKQEMEVAKTILKYSFFPIYWNDVKFTNEADKCLENNKTLIGPFVTSG